MSASNLMNNKGYRAASKAAGDDVTRSRFVRVDAEPGKERKRQLRSPRLPGMEADFIREARTKFTKSVKAPDKHILVSGHNNIKIGRDVRKGHFRGYWIYTLSLEERKTCPSSCKHWQTCYGNNMPFAKRVDYTHPDFLPTLEAAIDRLCSVRERQGVLIRLHALGDFFSSAYVGFWRRMLVAHPNLAIYGYTAHPPMIGSDVPKFFNAIGNSIRLLNRDFPRRSMIRFSNGGTDEMSTVSIGSVESCPPDAFVCPEQTGKTLGCDTCGACWGTKKNVAFLEH